MKRYSGHITAQALAIQPRHLLGKAVVTGLIASCIVLMAISRTAPDLRNKISSPIADSVAPMLDVLSRPIESLERFTGWFYNLIHIYGQNEELREANARLLQWQQAALQLQAENAALRKLTHYTDQERFRYTSAKVIGDRGGPFSRTALINAGIADDVATGQAVVNPQGLVGRIIEAGKHSARILLLTDINSRMPVISEQSRERSIAAGNNTDTVRLLYLPDDSKLTVGERIVTSGDGDTVPAGLPVGEVTAIHNGIATIRPYASWFRLEYVSIIRRQ